MFVSISVVIKLFLLLMNFLNGILPAWVCDCLEKPLIECIYWIKFTGNQFFSLLFAMHQANCVDVDCVLGDFFSFLLVENDQWNEEGERK